MKAVYSYAASAAIALLALLLPLPLAELALSLSLAIAARALGGIKAVVPATAAAYLAVRGFVNLFVVGAAWAVEPLPLLAAGYYLARSSEARSLYLFAASRALYFAAVLVFLTAPFLPGWARALWIPALLLAVGSPLRRAGGSARLAGLSLTAAGLMLAVAFLVSPLSEEASNDIIYIALIGVPAVALVAGRGEGEEYIPTPSSISIAADDRRFREAAEEYVERGRAEAVIAIISYAYALAGLPVEAAVNEALALRGARGKKGRKRALESALSRLKTP
ncbi:hypothetical protein TUZN_2138 [Thermoproteus uzoniensis 768-20]|uniref:Uncharacterized protein n=1 Tax=Thermoproteus uzoniensis (strain 768-20) TaxID=999630 RepID=F2L5P9_THEU7|nr:hypothetical protein [Thermoproteus uzoniensis]AEA13595.1 hypothetical protein TUZN_2138 [Thermoproteus uzoniensis 768-20]